MCAAPQGKLQIPRSLPFGVLDRLLSNNPGAIAGTAMLMSIKWIELKEGRKAVQLVDGGTSFGQHPEGVIYTCRMIVKAEAASSVELDAGAIVEFGDLRLLKIKTGEKILEAGSAKNVDSCYVSNLDEIAVPHPKSDAPNCNMLPPGVQEALDRIRQGTDTGAADAETSPYGPHRPNRQSVVQQQRPAEPYKPVQRRHGVVYLKINDLNGYVDKWTIKARISAKSAVRHYSNARGEGKVFSVELIDADEGQIKASFFNEACDIFCEKLEQDRVYTFARGSIKQANPRFNTLPHAYELTFGADAEIVEVEDHAEVGDIPRPPMRLRKIASLANMSSNDPPVDILACVVRIQPTTSIILKGTGQARDKRNLQLLDDSGQQIETTLWGDKCSLFDSSAEQNDSNRCHWFVLMRRGRVGEWQGNKQISTGAESQIEPYCWDSQASHWLRTQYSVPPESIPELEQLRAWYFTTGRSVRTAIVASYSRDHIRSTISEMKHAAQGSTDLDSVGIWFTCRAAIVDFNISPQRKFFWPACPTCNRKVVATGEAEGVDSFQFVDNANMYTCVNCNTDVPAPDRKFIFTFDIQDHTDTLKLNAMGDAALRLIGVPANEVNEARVTGAGPNGEEFTDYFNRLRRKEYVFRIKAQTEQFQDETRLKYRMYSCDPVEAQAEAECRYNLALLEGLLGGLN